MVIQTHHYQRPGYLTASLVAGGAALGLGAFGAPFALYSAAEGVVLAAGGALALALAVIGVLCWLRFQNECLYLIPGRLVYVDRFGRRRLEMPYDEIAQIVPLPAKHAAVYEIQGSHGRIRFDKSITDCEALVGELNWRVRKHAQEEPQAQVSRPTNGSASELRRTPA